MTTATLTPTAIEEMASRIAGMRSRTLAWDIVADCGDDGFIHRVQDALQASADTDDGTAHFLARTIWSIQD